MKSKEELNALKEKAETVLVVECFYGSGSAAGDLRKLFFRQLTQLFVQGFHFLFQGVQFFFRFHGRSSCKYQKGSSASAL